jgi:hypothetical protein
MRSKCRTTLLALVTMLALGALTASSALASGKPFVETKLATEVGFETTLNGIVNPNGAETKYYFEYGETASYGKTTASVSAGSGTSNLEESKKITGFLNGAHFRIVATNSNGTTDGADETFGPQSAITQRASNETATGATLRGTVTPDNVEAKYHFAYGTEPGNLTTTTAEVTAGSGTSGIEVEKSISSLTEGKKYYYRLVTKSIYGQYNGVIKEFVATKGPEFTVASSFTGKFGPTLFTIGPGPTEYEYRSGEISGEMATKSVLKNVTIKFFEGGSNSCDNGKTGELVWTGLTGGVGYIKSGEYGLVIEPLKEPIGAKCQGYRGTTVKYEYAGNLVGSISPHAGETEFTLNVGKGLTHLEGEEAFPLKLGEAGTWKTSEFGVGNFSVSIEGTATLKFSSKTKLEK